MMKDPFILHPGNYAAFIATITRWLSFDAHGKEFYPDFSREEWIRSKFRQNPDLTGG